MDDPRELERTCYNPALTPLASNTLSWPQRQESRREVVADPSGDVRSLHDHDEPGLSKYETGWRRIVRNFSPSWFSVTMGTGICGILLDAIPFHTLWLHNLAIFFFALNSLLFLLAFGISLLRYTLYPRIWVVMIQDPTNSLFLTTVPMGFATLIRLWVTIVVPKAGQWAVTVAWVAWMVDSVAAFGTTVFLPFKLMSHDSPITLDRITAVQLLPTAATIVAAGTGAVVSGVLTNPQHALGTILTCYVMWGMSVPLALTIIVVYYQRLAIHKLPSREVIVSCFLPMGPLGYGGFCVLYLGQVSLTVFKETNTLPDANGLAAPILYILGFATALVFWGFGIVWLILALASIHRSRPFPFNMGWWGFTFPLGVFAGSTIQIGIVLPSITFKLMGTIFSVAVILLWMIVAAGTAKGAWSGQLFYAPCLKNLPKEKVETDGSEARNDSSSGTRTEEGGVMV